MPKTGADHPPEPGRRGFLIAAGAVVAGAGLAVGYRPLRALYDGPVGEVPGSSPVGDWVHIATDGVITVLSTVIEMGQGSQTGIAQLVAEELDVAWEQVRVERSPFSRRYAFRGFMTGGSASIRESFEPMRQIGALARAVLVAEAAERFGVTATACSTDAGRVLHRPTGRALTYGELAPAASRRRPADQAPLKARGQWQIIGTSAARLDTPSKCYGSAAFGIDTRLPGQLQAAIRHAPAGGATLAHCTREAALAMPGVRQLVVRPEFVAVVANHYWQAERAAAALDLRWTAPLHPIEDTPTLRARLAALAETPDPAPAAGRAEAQARARLEGDGAAIERSYSVPLLAQAGLEPLGATAEVTAHRALIVAATQDPSGLRASVARAIGLRRHQVEVQTTWVGGGFGRRLGADYAVEAAIIAQAVGRPVQLIWSREENFGHGAYRPAVACRLRAAVSPEGDIAALEARVAMLGPEARTGGLEHMPYAIPSRQVSSSALNAGIPLGAWRSVDASQNAFFLESFIDELAHAAGQHPIALRRRLLGHDPRAVRVLDTLAEQVSDGNVPGRGIGIAYFDGFGTRVAQACEVEIPEPRRLILRRVINVVDCGVAVNPQAIRAQFEGGVAYALTAALFGEITYASGRVQAKNFDDYRLLTMSQMPDVETLILESPEAAPGGVGEPPVPGIAPALTNAIFAATGERLRSLPLSPFEVSARG